MTLLSEKLKEAGIPTAQARLAALTFKALDESKGHIPDAVNGLWDALRTESWVIKDLWLLPYLRDRQRDMAGNQGLVPDRSSASGMRIQPTPLATPRPAPSPEAKAKVQRIINDAVKHLTFGHLTADGTDWADVGAHELDGMDRDGALARVVKSKLGVLSNSDRFKMLGELITPKVFNEARDQLKEAMK